jgi:hypothetical protein
MGPVATTTFRGIGPRAYSDQLQAIEHELGDAPDLDRGITRVVQLAEAILEEREQLLRWGHEQSHPAHGVFAKVGREFLAQMEEQAAAYSEVYLSVDQRLASWRASIHARLVGQADVP